MTRYKPKHMVPRKRLFKLKGKHMKEESSLLFNLSPLVQLLLLVLVVGTTAYLMSKDSISNTFVLGEINPEIMEVFSANNKTKEDVYIKNSGNVPTFVRTAVIIQWKDNEGKILYENPVKNTDYSISFSSSSNWIKSSDGYYYYKNPLQVNESTDILIEECIQLQEYIDKKLEVSIITQGIQAEPTNAVREAWNVNITNNTISIGGT